MYDQPYGALMLGMVYAFYHCTFGVLVKKYYLPRSDVAIDETMIKCFDRFSNTF